MGKGDPDWFWSMSGGIDSTAARLRRPGGWWREGDL